MSLSDEQIEEMANEFNKPSINPLHKFGYIFGAKAARDHCAKEIKYERLKRARWLGVEKDELVDQIENLEKLLDEWMKDYDKLKQKYEPMIIVEQCEELDKGE